MSDMSIAIMQPYLFPYIGYFQLVNAVDKFVFYDDVNFIKSGWINRNRILINDKPGYLTLQLKDASSNKLIKDVFFEKNDKFLKKIEYAYKKAPFFEHVMPVVEKCINIDTVSISKMAANSVVQVCDYLMINRYFYYSSSLDAVNFGKNRVGRLVDICRYFNSKNYVNNYSGAALYKKEEFSEYNIDLKFLKPSVVAYKQFSGEFVSSLSIIDVMMFNSKDIINTYLNQYELI